MAEEAQGNAAENPQEQQPQPAEAPQAEPAPKGKGNLMKYLLFGGSGLILVIITAVVVALVMGGDKTAEVEPAGAEESTAEASHTQAEPEKESHPAEAVSHEPAEEDQHAVEDIPDAELDFLVDENDESVLELIQSSLDYLDYQPEEADIPDEELAQESGMTAKDSIEAVNWLEEEKAKLAAKEENLAKREKELQALDRKVTQKITIIEQAESTRTASLAKLYDGMDARAVARLMANLDDATVVSIIPRMKQKNASQVLQLMPAQRAAKLSKKMITIAGN